MGNYNIRTKQGEVKLTLSSTDAFDLIDQLSGEIDQMIVRNKKRKIFILDVEHRISCGKFAIHLNKGDYFCKF
jgi:hypothetical protein